MSSQFVESKANSMAVTFKVIPRFTRLYKRSKRKHSEMIKAMAGGTNPKARLPYPSCFRANRMNTLTLKP
jgi:hypothetical protein